MVLFTHRRLIVKKNSLFCIQITALLESPLSGTNEVPLESKIAIVFKFLFDFCNKFIQHYTVNKEAYILESLNIYKYGITYLRHFGAQVLLHHYLFSNEISCG